MKSNRIVRKLAGPVVAAVLMLAVGAVTGVAQYEPPDPATTPGGVAGTPQGQVPQTGGLNDCIKRAKQKYRRATRKILANTSSSKTFRSKRLRTAKKKKKIRIKWCRRNFA